MLTWMRQLLTTSVLEGDEHKARTARFLQTMTWGLLAVSVVGIPLAIWLDPSRRAVDLFLLVMLVGGSIGSQVWLRNGRVWHAGVLFLSMVLVATTVIAWTAGGLRTAQAGGYFLLVLMAGMLLGRRGAFVFGVLGFLCALGLFAAERLGILSTFYRVISFADMVAFAAIFALTVLVLVYTTNAFAETTARMHEHARALDERNRELEAIHSSLEEHARSLEAVAEVAGAVASVLDMDELLQRVVTLVRDRFDLYYVGVFLLDESGEYAVLRASNGEAGRQVLAQGYRLEVGGDSMIGQCMATGQARVALEAGEESIRFDNPLLPETRSELALPLHSRGRVIGAMTVQSSEPEAFDAVTISAMQVLADQVAVAIDNARLFTESQAALARSRETISRYVRETWESFMATGTHIAGYRYTTQEAAPDDTAWLPTMEEAVQQADVAMAVEERQGAFLSVPLTLRGEVIGVMGLRRPPDREWRDDEVALARSVGDQVAQALENMRLLEETRRRALRERILRQTAERVRAQSDLDAVLKVAVEEMRRAVGATHVAIRLGTEERLRVFPGNGTEAVE